MRATRYAKPVGFEWLRRLAVLTVVGVNGSVMAEERAATVDFREHVAPIFTKYCTGCHNADEEKGGLILESFAALKKGGDTGAVVVPGESDESLLIQLVERTARPFMPPGQRPRPNANEIAVLRRWIDAGAQAPPETASPAIELVTPKIEPTIAPRRAIKAVAISPDGKWIALARYGEVDLVSTAGRNVVRTLSGHRGSVNAVAFSHDGQRLVAAAGEPGLFGEARLWGVETGELIRTFEGHRDSVYAVALSPDGTTVVTGSYDQTLQLWDAEDGSSLRTLTGHNGAVFDVAFRSDGRLLASVGADRTVKLWDVATGERRDTLAESLKELHAVAFSPDGRRVVAGGADNRIRAWQVSESAEEGSNPIVYARFAHEQAILRLAYSPDGKTLISSAEDATVKVWEAESVRERFLLEPQPDWPTGLAIGPDNRTIVVGRLDGTFAFYDATTGKSLPPSQPELARVEPRGVQRGVATRVRLIGKNLSSVTDLSFSDERIRGRLIDDPQPNSESVWIEVTPATDTPRGAVSIWATTPVGQTGKVQLHVDDLIQVTEGAGSSPTVAETPVSFWGTIDRAGDDDEFRFDARAGQHLVFDIAARRIGSKADTVLTLFDEQGRIVAENNDFDGDVDSLMAVTIPADGGYVVRVADRVLAASSDHFYRLSIGEFAYVTGCFPLGVPAESETQVGLIGYNLPSNAKVAVSNATGDTATVSVDPEAYRSRRMLAVAVGGPNEIVEAEPNDAPQQATPMRVPGGVSGLIEPRPSDAPADVDLYRFESPANRAWIIETHAERLGTPTDTTIEVLGADGAPLPRVLLQAVRDSNITFRPIDSNAADARVTNWEEMDLNQFVYMQGEVSKIFRMPLGPDSGIRFYTAPNGRRRCYFDTSATAHALDEPCYIVEPHPVGSSLVANGLPVFTLAYANDDDGERERGRDSRLRFTAPADGVYCMRVRDVSGRAGERFAYRLAIREAAPDFRVTLSNLRPEVHAGSGRAFAVRVDRVDGFDGPVAVEIDGLPEGLSATSPIVIEADHLVANGALHATAEAKTFEAESLESMVVTASADIGGQTVSKSVKGFERITVRNDPPLLVHFEPAVASEAAGPDPVAMTIAPGSTVTAMLRIERRSHDDLVTFDVENLPHGVIVDNIGLNGVLIRKGEDVREIFISAAPWVAETERLCYAVAKQAGEQTSRPVRLQIRRPAATARADAD